MLLRSFRLRMALWSMLVAGVAGAGFGAVAWWSIRQAELLQLDHDLSARGLRELARPEGPGHWALLEMILADTRAGGRRDRILVLALDPGNHIHYRSSHWPKSLDLTLPPPAMLPRINPRPSGRLPEREAESGLGDEGNRVPDRQESRQAPAFEEGGASPKTRVEDRGARLQRVPTPQQDDIQSDRRLPARPPIEPWLDERRPVPRPPILTPGQSGDAHGIAGDRPRPPRFRPGSGERQPPQSRESLGLPMPPRHLDDEAAPPAPGGAVNGRVRPVSVWLAQADAQLPPQLGHPPPLNPPEWFTLREAGKRWRIAVFMAPERRLVLGVDLEVIDDTMAVVRNGFLIALPVALALIALGAWFLSDRALRPLRRLAGSIRRITAQGLSERVPSAQEDREFDELITVFNAMLERLERGFLQASRFSADAAHELKTPLAILQGEIERALQQVEPASAIQATLSGLLVEVRRLSVISRKLLLLAQADAGGLRLHRQTFDLSRALAELAEDARLLAPSLTVREAIAPGINLCADPDLLRQLLHNLVSNAIKYNLPRGWIEIGARTTGLGAEVSVANASAGIPPADRERIFDRFYRADPSRSRQRDGVGLGLALAREIARAHQGDLRLASSAEGETRFVLVLPDASVRGQR